MNKFCQSCGLPLTSGNAGTELDQTASSNYCRLCYQAGAFIEPDITLEEIKARGLAGIKQNETNVLKRFLLTTFYPMQLRKLDRWR